MNDKITIHTEGTPNPNALKFVLNKTIVEKGSCNFPNKEKAKGSPLALKLFELSSVEEVLFGKDFITITKSQNALWESIYDKAIETISKHVESGKPIVVTTEEKVQKSGRSDVEEKILEILDSQIRPAVASDGGDVIFDSFQDGVLKLHLQGSCSSCPSSVMTLKAGIESLLKKQIPELKEVISI